MQLIFKKLVPQAVAPKVATPDSAGFDLSSVENTVVMPRHTAMISTGLSMEIPKGNVGMVCPRSGLALKKSITVANSPGIIDADYRGEIKVLIINHGGMPFEIKVGDRIAQLLIMPVITNSLELCEAVELNETERGEGGFGSTGSTSL